MIEGIADASFFLARHRIGGLMAIQGKIGIRAFLETGTAINAPLSAELLSTIFFPNTPLHDGGVIIAGDRILAAGCIFPLTQSAEFSKTLGTRHRAGVGITEETDAIAVIVSEETGTVSLACRGRLVRDVDRDRLERHLRNYLSREEEAGVPAFSSDGSILGADPDVDQETMGK
jgi:diadenylate cyclase